MLPAIVAMQWQWKDTTNRKQHTHRWDHFG
jgi:hypothetical protein